MNLSYGGTVPDMHDTTILDVGEFKSSLSIGDTQSMNFTAHDSGPFWMDNMTKISTKYDDQPGMKIKRLLDK